MENVVTRVERVRVKFIVVECRSLCCCVVEVVSNEYVKHRILYSISCESKRYCTNHTVTYKLII